MAERAMIETEITFIPKSEGGRDIPDGIFQSLRYRPHIVIGDPTQRQAIIADGTVYFGTTVYGGKVAFRPAIANWRTTERDVDVILGVARGLAERIAHVRQPT